MEQSINVQVILVLECVFVPDIRRKCFVSQDLSDLVANVTSSEVHSSNDLFTFA